MLAQLCNGDVNADSVRFGVNALILYRWAFVLLLLVAVTTPALIMHVCKTLHYCHHPYDYVYASPILQLYTCTRWSDFIC